jgi:cell division protein FtsW (lipid II flippase)
MLIHELPRLTLAEEARLRAEAARWLHSGFRSRALTPARCLSILVRADNLLGRLLIAGVVSMLAFHIIVNIVNIGMTIGLMPVTGVPLPFFSYGLSALIVGMAGIGLVLSVGARLEERLFD